MLRAQGRCRLGEDDDVAGSVTAWGRWCHGLGDVTGSGRMMALQSRGQHEINGIAGLVTAQGRPRRGLEEDDGVAGLGTA
jgi:hypothetical protein